MVEKSGLRIASFNIQKFSAISVMAKANGETKKDLDTIGRIIQENQFDIIAIQEIYHKEALKELLEKIAMQLLLVQTPRIYAPFGANIAETEPDLLQSQIRFCFALRPKKVDGIFRRCFNFSAIFDVSAST